MPANHVSPATRSAHSGAGAICLVLGVVAGIAFMGWAGKPATIAIAAPAPVAATVDYAKITEAVRAGFPAPVAAPVAAKPAPVAAPAPVKRKVRTVTRTVYLVPAPARCGCAL